MSSLNTFAFLDESGNPSKRDGEKYYGVGALFHPWPDETIIKLHEVFTGFSGALQKDPTRLELKFNEVTGKSLPFYLKALTVLKNDQDWRFCSVTIDKTDPKYLTPTDKLGSWECYLRWVKHLLSKNIMRHEHVILLADYCNRPIGQVHSFSTLPQIVPNLTDVLQVESQGVLLVQMADILLGSSVYDGVDVIKKQLADEAKGLLKNLGTTPGGKRYNRWNPIWR